MLISPGDQDIIHSMFHMIKTIIILIMIMFTTIIIVFILEIMTIVMLPELKCYRDCDDQNHRHPQ